MFLTWRRHEQLVAEIKQRYEAQLVELRRTADILAEQVEYLRATGGLPQPIVGRPSQYPSSHPMMLDATPWLSEEEEDVRQLHAMGELDADELSAALEQIGFINARIDSD